MPTRAFHLQVWFSVFRAEGPSYTSLGRKPQVSCPRWTRTLKGRLIGKLYLKGKWSHREPRPGKNILILSEGVPSLTGNVAVEGPAFRLHLLLFLLLTTTLHAQSEPSTVRIAVLTLFHPRTLTVTLPHPTPAQLDGHPQTLATVTLTAGQTLQLPDDTVTITVPGKLTRTYRGALTVTTRSGAFLPVLTMDPETAVASIVAAEAPPNAPFEALKAQAIASRSFLLATPPGPLYDATDTTHDQFLRSPPPPTSSAARATAATRHVVLTWQPAGTPAPRIVRAMYARSCGGHTRPHPSAKPADYPFYAVPCAYCLRHPERWSRPAVPTPTTEAARIAYNRTHGWQAIPSNTHTTAAGNLQGQGTGHGVGLCQLGAADLAAHGQTAAQILGHYYPNTALHVLP